MKDELLDRDLEPNLECQTEGSRMMRISRAYSAGSAAILTLLLLPEADWHALRAKEKLPKGKLTPEVMPIVIEVLQKRLGEYPTSIVVSNSIVTLA